MNRVLPIRLLSAAPSMLLSVLALHPVTLVAAGAPDAAIRIGPGPQLFIDDYLVSDQSFLTRTVNRPAKLPDPVITGGAGGDDNFQPYVAVLRDPDTGRFRVWYATPVSEVQSHLACMDSNDGIHWIRPHRVLADPQKIRFGVSVLDRGKAFVPADQRYVYAFHEGDGMKIAVSADGLQWRMLTPKTVWPHNHDIDSIHWDPIRKQYIAIGSVVLARDRWGGKRRIPFETASHDLLHWEENWPIIEPKIGAPIEQGETQFYAMAGVLARGDLLIGLVKVLRDDLNATPGKTAAEMGDLNRKAAGLGYTVLAWTRDGRHWQRDDQPFLVNDPDPARWDHAMAWGDAQLVVGDQTYVYYGGYKRGHKVARFDERQIGLAIMPRDRYVAREADLNPGRLVTKPLLLEGASLTVNAQVVGRLRVRLLDVNSQPLTGFDWCDLAGDAPAIPVPWTRPLTSLSGQAVRLEFELTDARLFGFDVL